MGLPYEEVTVTFSSFFPALSIRIIFSIVTSFVLAILLGPRVIRKLRERQIGQTIREEGVKEHQKKAGIPTMGGIIILIPVILTTVLWAKVNYLVDITLFSCVAMGLLGTPDDLPKVLKARSLGLTPRQKLAGQLLIGMAVAAALTYLPGLRFEIPALEGGNWIHHKVAASTTQIPLVGTLDLQWLFFPFVVAVIVGSSNAVNLTDGLDGLATGVTAVTALPFLMICYVTGHYVFARHLGVMYIPGAGELAVICAALFGGCLGFLWHNAHPAEVFMGDTGSLALGGTVGGIAVCTRTEVFLAIIGGIFVLEALSVILQVSYFKWTKGKRIFLMSPIHHHFELAGWPEEKVVIRFWIMGLMFALIGLALFAGGLVFR